MTPSDSATRRPLGRRSGDPADTRRAILQAAQATFAANGYERATIRAIALAADVDPGLVIHHFGSKQALFASAHRLPVNPAERIDSIAELPLHERGTALTRAYLSLLAGPDSPAFSLLRAAATNEAAASMLREFVTQVVLERADEIAPGPDAQLRLALAVSHLIGIAVARELILVPVFVRCDLDDIVAAVSPTIQRYLDGP